MNYSIVFAGGVGQRMNTTTLPKQFLLVHGKPIIVHTIQHFQNCEQIDGIVVVCLKEYIDYMKKLKKEYNLTKIIDVVSGGESGQQSIYNGLLSVKNFSKSSSDIVLIHDGVRPIIDNETIISNIECVKKNRTCITVAKSTESVLVVENGGVSEVVERSLCYLGRAPQSFYLNDVISCHQKAREKGLDGFVDSANLMSYFGYKMHTVLGPANNIKITTPTDYFMFRALLDEVENEQIKFD